jgi:hypothetical protein
MLFLVSIFSSSAGHLTFSCPNRVLNAIINNDLAVVSPHATSPECFESNIEPRVSISASLTIGIFRGLACGPLNAFARAMRQSHHLEYLESVRQGMP